MKRIIYISMIIFLIFAMFSNVLANELQTTLNVIQKSGEIKYLENDQGYISKTVVDSKSDTGEVEIELSLSNTANNSESEEEKYDSTEIFIIVNENIVHDSEKLSTYISYIDTLATKIFGKSSNTKIGIIGMKGTIHDAEIDENGNMVYGENDERTIAGTENNAEIAVNLTKNAEDIKTGLQNMNSSKVKYNTNLQAAIRLANNSYSENANKLLISLYDGVPTIAIGVQSQVNVSSGTSPEEALKARYEKVASKTKSEILTLKNNDVEFILLRPDDTSYNTKYYNVTTGELVLDFDGSSYVQEIYGTLENPTYGKMYSLNNDTLEVIVTEYIYEDIIENIRVDIKSAVINEYFSEDILNNFDIAFSDENVDTTNLDESGYIVWNIGNVKGNATATLQYTLKIKDMKNKELLDKVISTSEKTELSYINYLDKQTTAISTDSPKIQLSEVKELEETNTIKVENEVIKDNTIANSQLPKAGVNVAIIFAIVFVILFTIFIYKKYHSYKDVK